MDNQFNIKEVKVHRTLEGTIFEAVILALVALIFAIIGHESPLTSVVAIGLAIVLTITAFLFMFLIQKAE